jgi:hypothetical protein
MRRKLVPTKRMSASNLRKRGTTLVSSHRQRSSTSGPITGHGDDVIIYTGDTKPAAITHAGASNFAVQAYPTTGGSSDLLVWSSRHRQ